MCFQFACSTSEQVEHATRHTPSPANPHFQSTIPRLPKSDRPRPGEARPARRFGTHGPRDKFRPWYQARIPSTRGRASSDLVRGVLIVLSCLSTATRRVRGPEGKQHRQRRPTHPISDEHGSTLSSANDCLTRRPPRSHPHRVAQRVPGSISRRIGASTRPGTDERHRHPKCASRSQTCHPALSISSKKTEQPAHPGSVPALGSPPQSPRPGAPSCKALETKSHLI